MLTVGQILQDRYTIEAVLGQGGMVPVYQARDVSLQVPCVVKEMCCRTGQPDTNLGRSSSAKPESWPACTMRTSRASAILHGTGQLLPWSWI